MKRKKRNRSVKLVSVIIPAYKQEKTIKRDIKRIISVLDQLRHKYEIIVVVDGEMDNTRKKVAEIKNRKLKIHGYQTNKGKGHAIRYGMAKAKGDVLGFIDAGMDLNPNGLAMLLEHFEWYNADIIIGSKLHPVSKVSYPFYRKILSLGYRFLVRILFGLKVKDTQVGMKFFCKEVVDDVLPRLLVKEFAFDIEMLAVAHRIGHKRIYEAPIELDFRGVSSISSKGFWRTIKFMLIDTLAVYYRLKILKYYDNKNKKKWKYKSDIYYKVNVR